MKTRTIITLLTVAALTGCATPEMRQAWQQDAQDLCLVGGATPGTAEYDACVRLAVRGQEKQWEQQVNANISRMSARYPAPWDLRQPQPTYLRVQMGSPYPQAPLMQPAAPLPAMTPNFRMPQPY